MNHATPALRTIRSGLNACRLRVALALAVAGVVIVAPVSAQNGRPTPAQPTRETTDADRQDTKGATGAQQGGEGRKPLDDLLVKGGFKDVSVGEMIEWIASLTGKVVIPVHPQTLNTTKITLIIEDLIDKNQALDLIFTTFRLNGIGVIETEKLIIISTLDEIQQNGANLPVLDAETNVMGRKDLGTIVIKIFKVVNRNADGILEQIDERAPSYTSVSVDVDSNSIVVLGDVGYCQQVQRLIDELDKQWTPGKTITYRLAHADAQEIADNILELFESSGTGTASRRTPRNSRRNVPGQRPAQAPVSPTTAGPEVEMRVTVNIQQNTVTVKADSTTIEQITRLIEQEWDLPRPDTTSKVYILKYTDPIKVRDTLNQLLGTGGGGGSSRSSAARANVPSGGAVGGAGAAPELGNIYRIEAFPDQNSLIVIGKTEATFGFLDDMIDKLDQPTDIGLPLIIELNHADAVELSEELNALLQEPGAGVGLAVEGGGLSATGLNSGGSTAGTSGGAAGGGTGTGAVGREAEGSRDLQFPWQRARQDEDRSPESPLIGLIRIMPIVRQNALAILCPIPQREAIRDIITTFDRPGRQVMISAIIAEVDLTDDLALGLRVSSSSLSLTNIDNALSASVNSANQELNVLPGLFHTSTLDVNLNANAAIQALAQMTDVRILQEPRVYTADNQEAYFFDGQDVPFIDNSNTTDQGGLTQSFNYRQVGVSLNVRPRITAQNDVNMEVYLELSSIVPGQTLFGGFIIDRRSTTTEITIKNGQTILVSGILRDSESQIERKVPFLGDIPLIGELFKSRENQNRTSELVAFITPVVVDDPSIAEQMSEDNLRTLRDMNRPMPDIVEDRESVKDRIIDRPVPFEPTIEAGPDGRQRPRDLRDDTKGKGGRGN